MSDSYKKPIEKDTNGFMKNYFNRRERRKAKEHLKHGEYDLAEGRQMPTGSYDITDWIFDFRYVDLDWWDFTEREWHQIIGK